MVNELKEEMNIQMEQLFLVHEENALLMLELEKKEILDDSARPVNNGIDFQCSTSNDLNKQFAVGEQNHDHQLRPDDKLSWLANRWDPSVSNQFVHVSANGLNVKRKFTGMNDDINFNSFVRTIRGIGFPPPAKRGCPQVCYFEMKHVEGTFSYGFCAKEYSPSSHNKPLVSFSLMSSSGYYSDGEVEQGLTQMHEGADLIPSNESAIVGCGILKDMGLRRIFFTKNGQLLAKPIRLPSAAPNELFPFINLLSGYCRFVETNFGERSFAFDFEENEDELAQEMIVL